MEDSHGLLQTLALVLCVAAATTILFHRLKQPVVLGYLLAGMVVGPLPIPLYAELHTVEVLAELGVILLMFSLGIEFSLTKLLRVGATAGCVAVVQCSLMLWIGFVIGKAFGWSHVESMVAGAVVAISSTTIIVKAFEEQGITATFTQVVFGILIVEDLIAILLLTLLTTISSGKELTALEFGRAVGYLALFLTLVMAVGIFLIPRIMQAVVRLNRTEITVVTSVAIAFGFAMLAAKCGYSVALGAFIAGALVAESGVEKTVEHLVQPVRDIFAAIFFVSVGMLIDPAQIASHWFVVAVFLVAVVVGKILSVTLGAFLTGQGIQNSVKIGMSLAQIGEFSFIIAGVGLATESTGRLLYSIAVAVSAITTLLTPWLIRLSPAAAAWIDRKLPRSLQTVGALYASWLENLRNAAVDDDRLKVQRAVRWLIIDTMIIAAIVIGASVEIGAATSYLVRMGMTIRASRIIFIGANAIIAAPFMVGLVRVSRFLGFELAARVFPSEIDLQLDLAAAPRRLLVAMLQLSIIVAVGVPLVAVTQPFLPSYYGAAFLGFVLILLAIPFWRGATNLQGHARASAEALVEVLIRQAQTGRPQANDYPPDINETIKGFGAPVPIALLPGNPNIGKTLAEIKLRGLTGATVLAIKRGQHSVLIPTGHERLQTDDVLAVAGTHDSVATALRMLSAEGDI